MLVEIAVLTCQIVGVLLVVYFLASVAFEIVFRLFEKRGRS